MLFAFIGFIVFRSAFASLLAVPGGFGATGVWYGEALANVLMVTIAGGYFLRGTWAGRVIDDGDTAAPT
jgi:Na+-driven multidrug efflux pump